MINYEDIWDKPYVVELATEKVSDELTLILQGIAYTHSKFDSFHVVTYYTKKACWPTSYQGHSLWEAVNHFNELSEKYSNDTRME